MPSNTNPRKAAASTATACRLRKLLRDAVAFVDMRLLSCQLQVVLIGGRKIRLAIRRTGVNQHAVAQLQLLAGSHHDFTRLAFAKRLAAELVGFEQSIIARVKPAWSEIVGMSRRWLCRPS